ncbi:MAG: hypothetical protein IPK19_38325 [Chloroflexi bacterium]|nr:hypothetical protein [Chloroflexota bacterium]
MRQNLAIFGCIAAFTGILTFVLFGAPALWSDDLWRTTVMPTAVYVGSGGCLTCHSDENGDWTDIPTRTLNSPDVENPHAIATSLEQAAATVRSEIQQNRIDRGAELFQTAPDSQQYMILTESGYSPLPSSWEVADHPTVEGEDASLSEDSCTDCHLFRRETMSGRGPVLLISLRDRIEEMLQ